MHKFFRGSKKTIAAMMAVLMFTSSTGGYAQAGMIQDAFPETQKQETVQETTDAPVTDTETVVTKPETESSTVESTDESTDKSTDKSTDESTDGSMEAPTPEVTETPKPTEKLEEKNKDASKETTADSEQKPETSTKAENAKETSEDSNELSNTVTRFMQEKDSYAYMEQITNMDDLLSEMDEEQLYELLYFMRLSFLSEVPENHSQTLDTYYEILNAYIRAKTGDPKQEWQDLVLPYLPYYQEGMETTEDYLDAVDRKDFDLSYLEEQLASLEDCQDSDILADKAEPVTIEAAMESVRQDVLDGNPADAVWTMYHYGYMADVLAELDYETLEGFFQGLDEDDRYVFNTLAGYEYFRFVDHGYALDGYKEKAEMLQYFYQEAAESEAADQILLSYLNKQDKKTYGSVDAYVAEMTKDSSENFDEVMEAWNLFLAGRVDTLVKKVNKEEIKDEPSKPEDSHEPLAPDTPDVDVPDTGDSTGDDLGGAGDDLPKKDIGTGDTLSDVEYPSLGKNYNDGIALASAQYNKNVNGGQWVAISNTWYFVQSNGAILYNSWVLDGNTWYFIKPNGWAVVSAYAVIDNVAYHFNASGADDGKLNQGWVVSDINGGWYYIYNGTAQYGWVWPQEKSVADAAGNTYCYYWCGPADDRVMRANGYYSIWCAEAGQNLDYYLDSGGHQIQATIGGNSYYSAFNAGNGAIDCAWNGSTVVLKGGNHNVSAQHAIIGKNVTITTDGSHRCYIRNSNTTTGGNRPTILFISKGTLTINGYISWDGGNINSGKAASDVLIAENGSTLTFDSANAKVFNCNQGLHGTSDAPNGAKINFYAGEIYNCILGIGTYNNVTMTGGTIRNCAQGVHLNACYRDIVCDITGGTIKDNSSYGIIGISADWGSAHKVTLTVTKANVFGNGYGVGLTGSITANSCLKLDNGTNIHNNTHVGTFVESGSMNVGETANVDIVNNGERGAVVNNVHSTGTFNKATITGNGNSSMTGAGIYTTGTISTTANTNISNNRSSGGGGIFGADTSTLNINGTPIKNNTANGGGGGICSHGTLNLNNATLTGNTATGDGGAIWYNKGTISKSTITGNTSNNLGGGVSLSHGTSTVSDTSISNNKANQGGGMYTDGNLTINNCTYDSNNASSNGGGIISNGTVTMNSGSITNNYSGWDGGGVNSHATFHFNGGTISNNTAGGDGGGIYNDNGNITLTAGTISGNKAQWGGGINDCGTVTMKGGTISGNSTTSKAGAGINVSTNGKLTMSGGKIQNNTSAETGGGICNLGTLEISGGEISGNTTKYSGGGIYNSAQGKGTTITGGTISGNTAETYGGGGIYIEDNSKVTMTGGTIKDNTVKTNGKAIYQNGTLNLGGAAEVLGDIYLGTGKIINVVSDLTKAKPEVAMAENDTYKQRVIAEYSADTTSYKNGTDDTKRYSLETTTAGYAKAKNIRIDDNVDKGKLYQVWLNKTDLPIRVNYIGRYADSGSVKTEIVEPGTEKYTVQKNSGYTGYSRKAYTFQGWATIPSYKKPVYSEKTTNVITYDDLRDIYLEQQEAGITGDMFKTQSTKSSRSVAGIALAAMQNALSGLIFPVQVQAAENDQVWDVYMLDTWDKVPTIKWTENTFWEGTDVYKADLLKNIQIRDEEDGTIDVSKLVINSITYSAGKLENGTKAASYTVNYPKGMQDSDKLDTWFMQLDKNDSPVTHVLHCSVTDSAGNVAKADITVKVKYNEFPTITAQDRYFTLEEAQGGQITKDALLKNAITDGKLSANDTEEGNLNSKLDMVDFKASDFTSFTDSGYVTVTFHVQDSMGPGGKGKETYRQIKVYVVKDGVIEEPEKAQNIRFINKKYYDLNKGVNPDTLSEEEKEARNGNGGLNVESKWYHDPEYQAVIEAAFGKTQGTDYEFTKEDIDKIKAYVDANGIGTTRSDAALDNFYSQFVAPAKVN